ncbi:Acyl transferase/acyl hydrolase/lysophospholipase [Penicillium capsulatum]|uniref:Acyl transferase/acyl hydrolase/lysophospholipase n=1 Tax=Penicillium capsulatum TaxID=69766 RepID=A0A9W9IUV6_9EURO|nr:Acyl transferase/acyl hydrolase/lysophospholipase [Penicillium capsulatum]KAJ6129410.1 Acyl transferase/acyl hydrolase/lysophospholipase [Penicillium capsulatum]
MPTLHSGPNPVDRDGLCLLSLDGGGVRGLSSLYILKCIMTLVNSERPGEQLKPCDVFDMIAGTSTGGLIAIMLGRLEMDVDECIEAYRELMKSIFSEKTNNLPVDWSGNIQAQYDSKKLRLAVENVVTRAGASPKDLLNDGKARKCRVFVCAVAKETLHITRLRSYDVPEENTPCATICEAALATSAATGFFEPVRLGDRLFVDGAFGANNPVEELEEEACDIWCHSTRDLKALTKCLVSIGTGTAAKRAIDDNLVKFLSKTLVRMVTKPEGTERRFMARWRNECHQGRCFRFNVEQGLQDVQMSDYQKRSLIETATHDYLRIPRQKSDLDECMKNLARKKGQTGLDFDIRVQEYKLRTIRMEVEANMQSSQTPYATHRASCWMVPFERNPRYVDREVVNSVKNKLFSGKEAQSIAICGLGGAGKTQIALELAHQTREQYPDCSVFWVPAMSPDSIRQAYVEMAGHLGIFVQEKEEVDVTQLVNDHLTQARTGRWLLIFDNADDLETWDPNLNESPTSVIPKNALPQHSLGATFFTTRSQKVARYIGIHQIIEIPEMDQMSATEVLKNSLVDKTLLDDKEGTAKLLQNLTYLPLAIVQAASFINQNSMNISSYISLLDGQEQHAVELFSEEFEDEGRYKSIKNPIATTWLTSFGQIQKLSQCACYHLSFMACIGSRNIPISLLPQSDQVEHQKALGILQSYSFIRLRPDKKSLDLHRLVHLATRIWLRSMSDSASLAHWESWALTYLGRMFKFVESDRSLSKAYTPHALKLLEVTPEDKDLYARMDLSNVVAGVLKNDGRFKESEKCHLQAIKCAKAQFGSENKHTVCCVANLATSYSDQGRLKEALELMTQNLHTQIKILGINSRGVTITIACLAGVYNLLDENSIAEWLAIIATWGYMKFFGPQSAETLLTLQRMVHIYLQQGRIANATELGVFCLEIAQRALEPDHPMAINAHTCLSTIYGNQGLWKDAERVAHDALEKYKEVLGWENPVTIRQLYQLATILENQGRDAEAISVMTDCAELSARIFGPHSADTKHAMGWIEYWKNRKSRHVRIRQRLNYTHKSIAILQRRKVYPQVKAYGGLWYVRRQTVDDTFIREVKTAYENYYDLGKVPDNDCPTVKGFEDEWSSDACSVNSKDPDYMRWHHGQETASFSKWIGGKLSLTSFRAS